MLDALAYLVAGCLLLQAVWRFPSVLRGAGRRRTLWGFFAAFSAAWVLKTRYVTSALDRGGINDLASLLKHVIAIVGICSLLIYVSSMYGEPPHGRPTPRHVRVTRLATRASFAVVPLLVTLFFFAIDHSHRTDHFVTGHAGELGMTLYMSVIYMYMASAAAVCAYQWGGSARRAAKWPLCVGLAMMSASMILAVFYAVLRMLYVAVITVLPPTKDFADLEEHITEPLQILLFSLLAIGAAAPAVQAVVSYPLWRDLALAVPQHVLVKPSRILPSHAWSARLNQARDVISLTPPQVRLSRCVTEVRDAIHALRYYAPIDLHDQSLREAQRRGLSGERAQAMAEALWMRSALAVKLRGGQPHTFPSEFVSGVGDDLAAETSWLLRVQAAYCVLGEERQHEVSTGRVDSRG
ncbi:MAB_1171c family putative transporter [Streptomyces triculaminicus]|uniref:MAB_1171c family putative transporter n=1 Tax=Streptomyces triculaminicus TaxID=2816232 RepID=UPI0037CEFEC1